MWRLYMYRVILLYCITSIKSNVPGVGFLNDWFSERLAGGRFYNLRLNTTLGSCLGPSLPWACCLVYPVGLYLRSSNQPQTHQILHKVRVKNPTQAWTLKSMHNQANFQFCQFFVVLHKIGHECIMTLHGHFTKITKKTKHGNVYNDRSTEKNGNQKTRFF